MKHINYISTQHRSGVFIQRRPLMMQATFGGEVNTLGGETKTTRGIRKPTLVGGVFVAIGQDIQGMVFLVTVRFGTQILSEPLACPPFQSVFPVRRTQQEGDNLL